MNSESPVYIKRSLKIRKIFVSFYAIIFLFIGIQLYYNLIYVSEIEPNNIFIVNNFQILFTQLFKTNKSTLNLNLQSDTNKSHFIKANNSTQLKKILFWGTIYNKKSKLHHYCIDKQSMDFCPFKCKYTVNTNELNSSDAIVIHGRESTRYILPKFRSMKQRWIFLMFESPDHSYVDISSWNYIFNWTMTYRKDSDIYIPYGTTLADEKSEWKNSHHLPKVTVENIKDKSLIAWAVSNCNRRVTSKRKSLVAQLSKLLPVDTYGKCGNRTCVDSNNNEICANPLKCHQYLGQRYKFYLAFENSICKEYITEKFFNSLKSGMVPIVYGPNREYYESISPPKSFIHIGDFKSIEKLANYLQFLDKSPLEYLKYFDWRKKYIIDPIYHYQRGWCNLCTKLYTADQDETKTYSSVHNWWRESVPVKGQKPCGTFDFKNGVKFK